jgi:hypothetical protein
MADAVKSTATSPKSTKNSRKTIFSFLPRLGSKERITTNNETSGSTIPRINSKEKLPLESVVAEGLGVQPGSKGAMNDLLDGIENVSVEETKMDDDNLERSRSGSTAPEFRPRQGSDARQEGPSGKGRTPTLKPTSSLGRFLVPRDKSSVIETPPPEIAKLQHSIQNKITRQRLVESLLPLVQDLSAKVRFVSAVDEYMVSEGKIKRQKGAYIVKMFVKKNSMFHLSNIPPQ